MPYHEHKGRGDAHQPAPQGLMDRNRHVIECRLTQHCKTETGKNDSPLPFTRVIRPSNIPNTCT